MIAAIECIWMGNELSPNALFACVHMITQGCLLHFFLFIVHVLIVLVLILVIILVLILVLILLLILECVCVCVVVYVCVGIPSCVCSCERAFTEFVKSIYTRIIYLNTKRRFTSLQKFRITSNEFTMMMPRMMPRMMLSRLYAHIQRNTHFMG